MRLILFANNAKKVLRLVFWPNEEEGNEEKYIIEDSNFELLG
jgi:hypothetical protein